MKPVRVDAVDGLRALAMTMVVAQHCGLLPFGWTGVWLFFVLSGYVITRGFLSGDYLAGGFRASYALFMRKRAARIVPVYLLYVAINVAVIVAVGQLYRLSDLPWLLSFTHNWHMIFGFWPGFGDWPPFGHLWTLSVEQQFYLLFPLLALGIARNAQLRVTIALICAGPLLRWAWSALLKAQWSQDPQPLAYAVYAAAHCHFDAFLLGSLVARLEPRLRERPVLGTRLGWAALAIALVYAGTMVAINHQLGARGVDLLRNVISGILYGQHREVFGYVAINALAAAALVHVLLQRPGSAALGWRPLAWVGRVSYGGYLFHALVLWSIGKAFGQGVSELPLAQRLAVFVAAWLITVLLASASFRWFEQPVARRWLRSGPSQRRAAPATMEPAR